MEIHQSTGMETRPPQHLRKDRPSFYAGELSKADYKGFSVVTEVMHRKMEKQV